MKEKTVEFWIEQYLSRLWAVVEVNKWWSALVYKGWKQYRIKLQNKGCPDITCLYKNHFIWIEVKRNEKEVKSWIKKREKFDKIWFLPDSYYREEMQIRYMYKILENWWYFILTNSVEEVMEFIKQIDSKLDKEA